MRKRDSASRYAKGEENGVEQEATETHEPVHLSATLKRRGMFAGLAALAAGILAHNSAPPAFAAAAVTLANDVGSTLNNETVSTYIHNTGSNTFLHTDAALLGESDNGPGVYGSVFFAGTPQVPFSSGVYGDHGNANGIGVHGLCNATNGTGVMGSTSASAGTGVHGISSGGGVGVRGDSNNSSNTSPGVYGVNTGGGPAIVGQATGSGFGFSAVTVSGTGCFGGASGSGVGVYAYSVGGPALTAFAAGGSNLAGYFSGPIYVTGALTVLGAKSAAVKGADGSLRRLYSMESPESWFEDFGTGQLTGGTATIQLASDFAGVVHGDNYHVFFTPRGEPKGLLYISKQNPNGFTVQESGGGNSNIGFSYRIVAKRKDIAGARLEQVDEPPTLEVPTFPDSPRPPVNIPLAPKRG